MSRSSSEARSAGDVERTDPRLTDTDWMNIYLGSGRCGGSFNRFGVMNGPTAHQRAYGATTLMHADHWHHGELGIDFHLPIARIVLSQEPEAVDRYRQHLDLSSGVLATHAATAGFGYTLKCTFHPEHRDLLGLSFESLSGSPPDLIVRPECEVTTSYGSHLTGRAKPLSDGFEVVCGTAQSVVLCRTFPSSPVTTGEPEIRISLSGRERGVLIAMGSARRTAELRAELDGFASIDAFFESARAAWSRRWGTACLSATDEQMQRHWARSMFWILSSFGPDARCPAPAMGWSGNGWQFNFPQDLSYVSPALLQLGHSDIVRSWVEFYASCREFTAEYTSRVYGARGTLWAWEHPIGCTGKLLDGVPPGTPNWFQHEIHNAAYPAQMAFETARALGDRSWARDVAWPVIQGSARFYADIATRESDGVYSVEVKPAMGQNEFEQPNRRNYLCSLFAAASTLARGVSTAHDLGIESGETELWARILSKGLAFGRLLDPDYGMFATSESDRTQLLPGTQKHPIQLDPLFALPLREHEWSVVRVPTLRALEKSELLCRESDGTLYDGWTLPSLALSAARAGDGHQALERLRQMKRASLTDREEIQLFESSIPIFQNQDARLKCYYTTNSGLVVQTLHSLVRDEFAPYTAHEEPLPAARDWTLG